MTMFQVIAVCFALFMMYVVSIHAKKKTLSAAETSWWISVWSVFIFIAVFPNTLLGLVHVLRFSRVFDLLLVCALMVLSLVVFLSYFKQKEAAQKLEAVVRSLALTKAETHRSRVRKRSRSKKG